MGQMTPEQQKELEEKLSKMSPEELAEFQKQQCVFCQIIQGVIPSRTVYKDDIVTAVMDINPAAEGHLLVLPNEHYAVLPQMPGSDVTHYAQVIQRLSHVVIRALGVEGTSIFAANGAAAGQRANHLMVHIIPRVLDDGIPLTVDLKEISEPEFDALKGKLKELFSGKGGTSNGVIEGSSSGDGGRQEAKREAQAESDAPPEQQESEDTTEGGKPDLDAIAKLLK